MDSISSILRALQHSGAGVYAITDERGFAQRLQFFSSRQEAQDSVLPHEGIYFWDNSTPTDCQL